ncbi:MAG: hypothetical protein E6559_04015 [Pantoea sp.]|nr:hypothetical protein [Pantoea sp.]
MLITPNHSSPQQHVGPVDEYNVDIQQLNGATHIKQNQTTFLDSDDTAVEIIQREVDSEQATLQLSQTHAELDRQYDYDELMPSEKRLALERHWTPIIQKLASEHEEACNAVAEFEGDQSRYRAQIQANFAYNCKHPDVRTIQCMGDNHFQHLMQSGQLQPEGYKMVDRRSMGGLTHKLVFIPQNVPSLMHYADSDEAKAFSQVEYNHDLQRLIQKRKNAAVALTQAKQRARDALAAIPTFEDLISEVVKRTKK